MRKNAPIIDGKKPNEQYDLDDKSVLLKLGLKPDTEQKIADKYVHYQNCKYAVVELKSSTMRKGIIQIEVTIERLLEAGKKVDYAIIVMKKLNQYERRFYRKGKYNKLLDPITNEPHQVKIGSYSWDVLIFYDSEVSKMYQGLDKYLAESG